MAELQRLLTDFTERGFVVLPVLSPDEVREARALLDAADGSVSKALAA